MRQLNTKPQADAIVSCWTGEATLRTLASRAVHLIVRDVSRRARLELSAHVLRHTRLTNRVRGGNDLVMVAEIAGHRRLETARRYTLPSLADREAAIEALRVEY